MEKITTVRDESKPPVSGCSLQPDAARKSMFESTASKKSADLNNLDEAKGRLST